MYSLEEAQGIVVEGCTPLSPLRLPVATALGCVLAGDVVAGEQVPPFDNSAMDGFAVRSIDTAGADETTPVSLRVVDTLHAGVAPTVAVGAGEAVRIMTGAPLPEGADAIVMVEATSAATGADGTEAVAVRLEVAPGLHVRRAGDDVQPGDRVLEAGTELSGRHLGVLCGTGAMSAAVHPRPVVGVFSTGDELVDAPWPLGPGQIRDTNRVMLCALLAADGFEAVDLGGIADDDKAIARVLRSGARSCDALVSSGGVSMGDADLVKVVLDRLGDMTWMQIAIKPAKPFAFGIVGGVPVFGLPGNPVSSAVSYELLARPGLRCLAGYGSDELLRPTVGAVAGDDLLRRADGKIHYVRVRTSPGERDRVVVHPLGGQGSHQLTGLAAADALAVVPDGDGVRAGERVELLLLG